MLGALRGFQELGEAGRGRVLSVRLGPAMGKPREEAAVWDGHSLPGTCWPRNGSGPCGLPLTTRHLLTAGQRARCCCPLAFPVFELLLRIS